ncbi:hypothetical protein ONZ45_g3957 [Pleurotus djamor]|nr:hypothetical protein ONZ45_g3957 [Pleurotus djamor]
MSFNDWHAGHDVAAVRQSSSASFVGKSTIEDFVLTPSAEEQNRAAVQNAETGRRSWKTVKGGSGEAVWSPQLEAALIEGRYDNARLENHD